MASESCSRRIALQTQDIPLVWGEMEISGVSRNTVRVLFIHAAILLVILITGCASSLEHKTVPGQAEWGIYELDRETLEVALLYASPAEIFSSSLKLSSAGDRLLFAREVDGEEDSHMEICTVGVDGSGFMRLTDNSFRDYYPVWSPDDSRIAFLSWREDDLDIYLMDANGGNERRLFDSGFHDADIDWVGDTIVFTSQYRIWRLNPDVIQPFALTDPPGRGRWGIANLPLGDYDPRISPDGRLIAFERLEDVNQTNGSYDIYVIGYDGREETRLTDTGYAQGLVSWSHSGAELVYTVAAISDVGQYDIYLMNADGTDNRNITPGYFPDYFLCHAPIFSRDDSKILFIGQRWQQE